MGVNAVAVVGDSTATVSLCPSLTIDIDTIVELYTSVGSGAFLTALENPRE